MPNGKELLKYFLLGITIFFLSFIFIRIHFDFVNLLIVELITIFSYLLIFIYFLVFPKNLKYIHYVIYGFFLFGAALLEIIHVVFFSGFYTNTMEISFELWIYARTLFVFGTFSYAILDYKFQRSNKQVSTKFLCFPILLTFLFILLSKFIPQKMFYTTNTTRYKSIFEVVLTIVLFVSAYMLRKRAGLFVSLLFAALAEISFILYRDNAFNEHFTFGYSLLISHAIVMLVSVTNNVFIKSLNQVSKILSKYNWTLEDLSDEILLCEMKQKILLYQQQLLLNSQTKEDVKKNMNILLDKYREFFKNRLGIGEIVVLYKDKMVYSTMKDIPREFKNWPKIHTKNIALYLKTNTLSKNTEEILKSQIYLVELKLNEIEQKDALQETTEELKRLSELRTYFLRSISHELKTPITVISGNVQLIKSGIYGNISNLKEPLESMEKALKRMEELVNNLLGLLRIEAWKLEVKIETLKQSLFEPLISEYRDLATQKGLNFNFEFSGEEVFSGDYKVDSMILSNLLSNAIKYTEKGSVKGEMKVEKEKIIIEVEDTGKGIKEEKLQKIFEPFVGEKDYASTGLGLSIVKTFVELLDGKIRVDSKVSKGTKFHVEIPRFVTPKNVREKEHIKLLLIEPDEELRKLVRKFFKPQEIVEASNGYDGYIKALEHTPDVILTKMNLSDVSGEVLVKLLEEESRLLHTRFIFYTEEYFAKEKKQIIEKGTNFLEQVEMIRELLNQKVMVIYTKRSKEYLKQIESLGKYTFKVLNEITKDVIREYKIIVLFATKKELESSSSIVKELVKIFPEIKLLVIALGGEN
ncbi:signal transduction histidine kinase/CheY-like chemotaxis protein [Thermosipho japonicus]|uniref:histidine kinase n=1 Tax=Thermosipho japonicus TaxID=90323 RepID=A0A841GHW3_9BACT|nr:ATP-binding protein [Thermosipho japonicus]MBB6061957.1 signal transduction histidine kinase/CheY-like chemotaxis protein [Thermosipho japonicus]